MTAPAERDGFGLISGAARAAAAVARLADDGAAVLPLLGEPALARLLDAARALPYRRCKAEVGSGDSLVRQDFDICMAVPNDNPLWRLAGAVEALVNGALERMNAPPLAPPFRLNDLVSQRYPAGSFGITAHRDHIRYVGLVALVPLSGAARFSLCRERGGAGSREVPLSPGELLLMRAPGFDGSGERPFHLLSDVTAERYCIGLRHDSRAGGA